jgi:cardiolipin synthase
MVISRLDSFDSRSFRLNDEANLNVYDKEFARLQILAFERDVLKAERISLEQWQSRPWTEKLIERAAAVLSPQL